MLKCIFACVIFVCVYKRRCACSGISCWLQTVNMKHQRGQFCNTNNTYVNNIINSSNYEFHRNKKSNYICSSDLIIHGLVLFNYAPLKRRIDGLDLFNVPIIGRSYISYNDNTDIFFTDNKLKVVDIISNRSFNVICLLFHTVNGSVVRIKHDLNDKNKSGLSLKYIMDTFLQVCRMNNDDKGLFFPKNIFTNDPLICELFHFLLSNFLMYSHTNIKICFLLGVKFNTKNIVAKLKSKRYNSKTRVVNGKSIDNMVIKNTSDCSSSPFDKYLFEKQVLIIKDCRVGKFPKIIINLAKNDAPQKLAEMKNENVKARKKRGRKKKENINDDFLEKPLIEDVFKHVNRYFYPQLMSM